MRPEISSYRTLLAPHMTHTLQDGPAVAPPMPRRSNLISTLAHLHLLGAQSRSELVAGLGLSRSGVGSLIGELLELGVALEAGVDRQASPGRPSLVVRLDAERAVALAVEIGPGEVAVCSVGLGGTVFDIDRLLMAEHSADLDHVVDAVDALVRAQISALGPAAVVVGVGVAVAGLVSSDGILQQAPNLGWRATDLRALLADALPSGLMISIGNESTYATIGEYLRGSLRGVENGLLISGNAGVGGGAIVNGRLLAGANGLAAEVGHMTVDPDGSACACGGYGCWETTVGLPAIVRASGLDTADLPPDVDVVAELATRAEAGDPAVVAALEDAARWLGLGLANLVNVLNPSQIVFGGRLGRLLPHLRAGIEAEMRRSALSAARRECAIVSPDLGKDAALIGASEQVFWNVVNNPDQLLGTRADDVR